jgi:hypothetical protein
VFDCVVVLVPSIYVREAPKAWGIPFFYWFQIFWILVSIVLTAVVYLVTSPAEPPENVPDEGRQ